jgi:hypothetical protein
MTGWRSGARLLAAAGVVLFAATIHAQNLNFLKASPLAQFTQEDVDLMLKNADDVLEAKEPAARREWSNPKTGATGTAEVLREFVGADGVPCKRLRVVNKAKSEARDVTHTVCKYEGRGWLVNSQAPAASKN